MLKSSVCIFFCQLFLLLPVSLLTYSAFLVPESSQTNPINDILAKVIKQRPTETLLLLNRHQNDKCSWKEFNYMDVPTIIVDEFTVFQVKDFFNSDLIAVVCLSELADSMLLPALANYLHRIRDVRVIIWLQKITTEQKAFLDIICHHASSANYLNLIVVNSNIDYTNGSLVAYRLQPFPTAKLLRIDLGKGEIFRQLWRNFHNKTAMALPSLYPPSSYFYQHKRTGQYFLSGFMDKLIIEFSKKYNISLQMQRYLRTTDFVYDTDIVEMTLSGEIDLSMHGRFWRPDVESSISVGSANLLIVVPCGDVMGLDNVYRSLKWYFLIVLFMYFAFSVIETLLVAATCRIFGRRYRFSWANLFINMNSFSWVLGLPINVNRNRQSMSLHQIIMIMSSFSMIITSYFNANLSTLFTMRPTDHHITNLKELREAKTPIIFDNIFRKVYKNEVGEKHLIFLEEQSVFLSSRERLHLFLSQNSSYAYQMNSKLWDHFNRYQKYYNSKTLCKHPELSIYDSFSMHVVLKNNSIFRKALNDYILWTNDLGFMNFWVKQSVQTLLEFPNRGKSLWHPKPLSFKDLQWVWGLIGIFYAVAILVFILESCINYIQRKREPRVTFVV
ncbi:hypothetical protein KR215_010027 [Drosophila sulfurigaster]|nr:hypothetical protein KR215_010027 [Drosophila sulfurigaster]